MAIGTILVHVEMEPHTRDLSGVMLNRIAPTHGAFILHDRVDEAVWQELKAAGADYWDEEFLEDNDMVDASPDWRHSYAGLLVLLRHGYALEVRGERTTDEERLRVLVGPEGRRMVEERERIRRAREERHRQIRDMLARFAYRQQPENEYLLGGLFPQSEATYIPMRPAQRLVGDHYAYDGGFDLAEGSGFEFVIADDGIWFVANLRSVSLWQYDVNDFNIVTTGDSRDGVGIRFEATPERLAYVRALEARPSIEMRLKEAVLDGADPRIWSIADAGAPAMKPRGVTSWSRIEDTSMFIGRTDGDTIWLASHLAREMAPYGSISLDGRHALAVPFPVTPERNAVAPLPDWITDPVPGRYLLSYASLHVSTTVADIVHSATAWGQTVQHIKATPGPTLIHASAGTYSGPGLQLWSDGKATRARMYVKEGDTLPRTLTTDAERLILAALGRKTWREDGRWMELTTVTDTVSVLTIAEDGARSMSGGWDTKLERLVVVHADGHTQTLYRGGLSWGYMAEDGDGGDETLLFVEEAEARAWMQEQKETWGR
jgi:hypothetical protein